MAITRRDARGVVTVQMEFGRPAQNDEVVRDAVAAWRGLGLSGGAGLRLTGRASLPVCFAIAHEVGHLFGWVAVFDPKLERYVVAITHDPAVSLGELQA